MYSRPNASDIQGRFHHQPELLDRLDQAGSHAGRIEVAMKAKSGLGKNFAKQFSKEMIQRKQFRIPISEQCLPQA